MKTALKWTLALLIFAAPGWAEAITVTITGTRGGITTPLPAPAPVLFTDKAGKSARALACTSNVVGVANSTAGTTACSRSFSVGGMIMTLRDISKDNRARVYLDDSQSSDLLNVAGLLASSGTGAISAATQVKLTITYSSILNEFQALTGGLYAYTAAMSGNFFNSAGGRASACTLPTPLCLTLKLTANGITVNQFGDNAVATVNVPPIDSAGGFGPTANPNETKSVNCGTVGVALSCKPSLQGQLVALYNGQNETLRVVGGAAVGGSHRPITAGGMTDTFIDVAVPEYVVPQNVFVDYTQAPTLKATLVQDGGRFPNLQEGSNVPLWWNLDNVTGFITTPTTLLRSIVSNADVFDDGAHVSFVSSQQAQVRDIKSIVAVYNWVTDNCSDALFVELQLATVVPPATVPQVIKIPLGCDSSGDNLVADGTIVQLPNGSSTNFKSMLTQFGGTNLRAVSVFLTKNTVNQDQEVELTSFTIGAFKTTFARTTSESPVFAENQLWCDFPGVNEFMMRVTPVDANGDPAGPSFIWGDAPNETFSKAENVPVANDCQLRTAMKVTDFPSQDRESAWKFELLYNLVPVGDGDISLSKER